MSIQAWEIYGGESEALCKLDLLQRWLEEEDNAPACGSYVPAWQETGSVTMAVSVVAELTCKRRRGHISYKECQTLVRAKRVIARALAKKLNRPENEMRKEIDKILQQQDTGVQNNEALCA